MFQKEIEEIRTLADKKHNGDLEMAIGDFLGASVEFNSVGGVPSGFEAAVGGIRWEIENTEAADKPVSPKTAGRTPAKLKE